MYIQGWSLYLKKDPQLLWALKYSYYVFKNRIEIKLVSLFSFTILAG